MNTKRWMVAGVVAIHAMLLLAGLALAHGGGTHVLGTVHKITDDAIEVQTRREVVTVALNDETRFTRGMDVIERADVEVGSRVAVHASTVDGKLLATSVQLPPGPRTATRK